MTDIDGYAGRFAGIDAATRLTDGPFAVGTRWRETRTVYGRSVTVENRVAECEPLRRYVAVSNVGGQAIMEYTFEPATDGRHTLVRIRFHTRGGGPAYRLANWLNRRMIRECAVENNTQDLADLAHACED
jgi:hypothetical protein